MVARGLGVGEARAEARRPSTPAWPGEIRARRRRSRDGRGESRPSLRRVEILRRRPSSFKVEASHSLDPSARAGWRMPSDRRGELGAWPGKGARGSRRLEQLGARALESPAPSRGPGRARSHALASIVAISSTRVSRRSAKFGPSTARPRHRLDAGSRWSSSAEIGSRGERACSTRVAARMARDRTLVGEGRSSHRECSDPGQRGRDAPGPRVRPARRGSRLAWRVSDTWSARVERRRVYA